VRQDLIDSAQLRHQTYGINCAQTVYGGPRGIWLECKACPASEVIAGSRYADEPMGSLSDAEAAAVFRKHGWTGDGDRMTGQRCPRCSAAGEA
jgi:hypothetical protein